MKEELVEKLVDLYGRLQSKGVCHSCGDKLPEDNNEWYTDWDGNIIDKKCDFFSLVVHGY